MKLSKTIRNKTVSLSTRYVKVNLSQVQAMVKDLVGESGYDATAENLFDLLSAGRDNKLYEKLVFEVVGESPISHYAIQKLGNHYLVLMIKHNGGEMFSAKATKLINLIENYNPSVEYKMEETIRTKNHKLLLDAVHKSINSRGKHATVAQVLSFLQPGLKLGVGRYVCHTHLYKITFNAFLGNIICEVEDNNYFKITVLKATELESVIIK